MPEQQPKSESTPVAHTKSSLYDLFYASKAKKTYTNLGVSLILIIIFLVFALMPTIQTIDTVREKIAIYQVYNLKVAKKVANAKTLEQQRTTSGSGGLKDEITFLNKSFLFDYNLLPIYDNFYRRAADNNVRIISINPRLNTGAGFDQANLDSIQGAPSTLAYQVTVNAQAKTLQNTLKYIKTVESYKEMPLLIRVRSVSISDQIESQKVTDELNGTNDQDSSVKGVSVSMTFFVYLDGSRVQ